MMELPINKSMKGMTIDEIAEELGIPWKTAHKRIETLGIKPLSYKALYDPSVVERIRNVPGKGRPPKAKPEEPDKDKKGRKA
jgi:predicted ArsR family transcriptional regulator